MTTIHPLYAPRRQSYSPNPDINDTILWLIEEGVPPLPIAPYHSPYKYPRVVPAQRNSFVCCPLDKNGVPLPMYSGKNPSYLNDGGTPKTIDHKGYQERFPSASKLKLWFAHPRTGIAALSGWSNVLWIDIDSKHFSSKEACLEVLYAYLDYAPQLKGVVDVTQSSGARIGIRCESPPNWGLLAFTPGGQVVGELLGRGRAAVLAPTCGVEGQYTKVVRDRFPLVNNLAKISLFAGRKKAPDAGISKITPQTDRFSNGSKAKPKPILRNSPKAVRVYGREPVDNIAVSFYQVSSLRVQGLLSGLGNIPQGERSDAMVRIARETFGWESWLSKHGYRTLIDSEEFLFRVGFELGLTEERIVRILNSCSNGVPIRDSMPGIYLFKGDQGCLDMVRYRNRR